jgi:DNA topoisomerase-2
MGVMVDAACALTEVKENKAAKKTDGVKTKSVRGIPKSLIVVVILVIIISY